MTAWPDLLAVRDSGPIVAGRISSHATFWASARRTAPDLAIAMVVGSAGTMFIWDHLDSPSEVAGVDRVTPVSRSGQRGSEPTQVAFSQLGTG